MGSFFTSTQIYAPSQHSKDQFLDIFCKKMKEEGYVICDSDESEISYILKIVDNCKWITITSETYEQGNQLSRQDASKIAKMLKTICINITVIDSDCAIMDLYNENGKKADSLIMGRADDYFGDDIPQPSKNAWSQFLSNGRKWEQFIEICKAEEVFIEESLSKLAETIGMNNENILFSAEDTDEGDKNIVFLHFKKANSSITMSQNGKAVNKTSKKLTLNTAFKQIFGEILEPMGFKLIKSKYPYYLRVVGEGIIQAISFSKEKSFNFDPNEEGISIYIGISLLSKPLINFDKNPTIIDNQSWMISLNELFRRFSIYLDGFNEKHEEYSFFYKKGKNEEMLDAVKKSRHEFMPFVLEFLEKPKTLEDIYQLGDIAQGIQYHTIILLERIDELIAELKKDLLKKLEMLESIHVNNPGLLKILKEKAIKDSDKTIKYFASLKKGGEAYDDYMKTSDKTKENNLKILEKLEVISKKG